MLTKKQRAKWAKALESGRYKQGRGELCDRVNNTYCCLGVLGRTMGVEPESMDSISMPLSLDIPAAAPKIRRFAKVLAKKEQSKFAALNDLHIGGKEASVPFEMLAYLVRCLPTSD